VAVDDGVFELMDDDDDGVVSGSVTLERRRRAAETRRARELATCLYTPLSRKPTPTDAATTNLLNCVAFNDDDTSRADTTAAIERDCELTTNGVVVNCTKLESFTYINSIYTIS